RIAFSRTVWLEGIGSLRRLINPCWNVVGNQFYKLDCHQIPGDQQYGDSATCSCKGPGSNIDIATIAQDISLYPNPASGLAGLEFELLQAHDVQIDVIDLKGRIIQKRAISLGPGSHRIHLSYIDHSGLYLVNLRIGNASWNEKLLVR
ncbi:MAG: T9SS type A sorting domain-containing protein, partial [Bacteroidia bacterium]